MVGGGLHLTARCEAEAEHLLGPARERVGQPRRHEPPAVVQRPDGDVLRAAGDELAEGDLGVGVGAQETGGGGEAARFTKVGEHGALVGALLEAAVELGQGDHRALELAGQDLEATADLGHLDLAALGAGPAAHELDVVDHDHPELADLGLQATGLGPDLHHGHVGVVVDPQVGLAQSTDGVADAAPVVLVEAPVADLGGVDPGLRAQQALGELDAAHLQREEQHRLVRLEGGVAGHAQGEAGLAHAGTGAHHHQGVGLQAGGELVEVGVARGRAGDGVAPLHQGLEGVEGLVQQVVQARHGVGLAVLGHLEHHPLGVVDRLGDVVGQAVADLGDLAGHADEAAQQRVLLDDLGVAGRARGGRGGGLQRDQGVGSPDGIEQVGAAQLLGHGDRIDRLALGRQRGDGLVDVAVGRLVEVVGRERLRRHIDRRARQQHGPEQALLGSEVVRRHPPAGPRAAPAGDHRRRRRRTVVVGRAVVEVGGRSSSMGWLQCGGTDLGTASANYLWMSWGQREAWLGDHARASAGIVGQQGKTSRRPGGEPPDVGCGNTGGRVRRPRISRRRRTRSRP